MKMHRRCFAPSDLTLVARAGSFRDYREPSLTVGDWVRLNRGSPLALIVDLAAEITVAWRERDGRVRELKLPENCFHRCQNSK